MTIVVAALDLPVWNPLDVPIDKVVFDGRFVSAGYTEIVGAAGQRKWEEYGGTNWSGGALLFRGWPLAHFVIRQTLYDTIDWDDWNVLLPVVSRLPGGQFPRPLRVSHPMLAQLGIAAVVIEAVRAPDQVDHGVWQIDLDCIEHRVLRAGGAAINDAEADPEDPQQRELADLEKQKAQEQAEFDNLMNKGNLAAQPL